MSPIACLIRPRRARWQGYAEEREDPTRLENDRRVLYTSLTRARHRVSIVLPPDPLPSYRPFTGLCQP